MFKRLFLITFAAASLAGALGINDWLSVNGSNQVVYGLQKENDYRWTWDILQTEVWAWRFAVGAEAEFNHPRRATFENEPDITGDKLVQRYARYRDDIFDVRAGTFDKTLGKGLTLRAYNDRDFNVYKVLDGGAASACVNFGGRQWGGVQVLRGQNKNRQEQNQDEDRVLDDKVWGGEVTFRPFDFVYVTGSHVKAEFEDLDLPAGETQGDMLREELNGGGLGGGCRFFDAYGEYAQRKGSNIADFRRGEDTGEGLYAVANGYLPRSSVSVEYKRYTDFWYPYNNPPPCSVDNRMIIGDLMTPVPTEWGYYAKATANPIDPLRFTGGYSYADDKVGETLTKNVEIKEYFATARYDTPIDLVVEGRYKYLGDILFPVGSVTGEVRKIPALTVSWSPFENHSFTVEGEHEWRDDYNQGKKYQDNRASLGYTYSSWLGVTGSYEDTDENIQEVVTVPEGEEAQYRFKQNWLWGEIRLAWYNKYFQNQVFTVGYGSRRGGTVCSSGMCRQELAFNGLKVNIESTF